MEEQINIDELQSIEISTEAIAAVQEQKITPLDFYIYCFVKTLVAAKINPLHIINGNDYKDSVDRLFELGLFHEEESSNVKEN